MSATCTVCAHPQRAAIDLALAQGQSGRSLGRAHGLSEAAVRRHKAHIASTLPDRPAPVSLAESDQLMAAAGENVRRMLAIVRHHTADLRQGDDAEDVLAALGPPVLHKPDHRTAVLASRALGQALELQAKLQGDLSDGGEVEVTVRMVDDFATGRTGGDR